MEDRRFCSLTRAAFLTRAALLIVVAATCLSLDAWAAQETVVHSFGNGTDGTVAESALISDAVGNLYGTTGFGGIHGSGTVFALSPRDGGGWTETVLHSFGSGTDGQSPRAGLVMDLTGNLYGTTAGGGIHGSGTVFELSPREGGGWTEKVLHSFNYIGTDGAYPYSGLILDAAGNLYGTTELGGIHSDCIYGSCGTVFEVSPRGNGEWTETVLHSFGGGTDGQTPYPGLAIDGEGNLYGTTIFGGIHTNCDPQGNHCGTVFELSPKQGGGWTERVLHSFGSGTDGFYPEASLILDSAGNLYGTTSGGGTHFAGAVFELSPKQDGGWTENVLYSFAGGTDGTEPWASLIMDAAGNLYGTTTGGGNGHDAGIAFRLSPGSGGWTEGVLHRFGVATDGIYPQAGLVLDSAGNLYGTTWGGGIHVGYACPQGCGTVFEITP